MLLRDRILRRACKVLPQLNSHGEKKNKRDNQKNMLLNLLLISVILVIITDLSGFPEDGLKPLFRRITGSIGEPSKIFTCSLCQTHWAGLIYLIVTGNLTFLNYAFVLFLAFMTPVTGSLLYLIRDFFQRIIESISNYFGL